LHLKREPVRLISPSFFVGRYNPVDWFPWGEEAFAKAKAEDKPIFFLVNTPHVIDAM
jgi:uncharacterized protein